jgi:hypothetical protein
MTCRELLESAMKLPEITPEAAAAYASLSEAMAATVSARMLAHGDIQSLVGPNNLGMMLESHRDHARFIAALLSEFDPRVLIRTVPWVLDTYRAHGFQPRYWAVQVEAWIAVLKDHLSEGYLDQIMPLYRWLNEHIHDFIDMSDRKLSDNL